MSGGRAVRQRVVTGASVVGGWGGWAAIVTLAERSLPATLERYIAEYRAFFKLDVELQLPEALLPLTAEQEITVFRIVQESLQNIQKHARATRVVVQLIPDDDALCAVIRDNGRGFIVQETEVTTLSGVGLRGMGERAAAVGGTLQVESQPGAGSTVRLVLPWATSAGTAGGTTNPIAGALLQELAGCEAAATLDRLELLAALAGLGALPAPGPAELVTRSQRLHQALTTGLLATWERAGWRTASGQPRANADLWQELARLVAARPVDCTLSRAEDGLPELARARQLAARAARERDRPAG